MERGIHPASGCRRRRVLRYIPHPDAGKWRWVQHSRRSMLLRGGELHDGQAIAYVVVRSALDSQMGLRLASQRSAWRLTILRRG